MPLPNLRSVAHRGAAVRRRWWVVAALVVVLAGAGAWFRLADGDDGNTTQRITATVTRDTYKDTVSATGTISPKRDEDLSFTSTGTVTDVEVAVGDRVRKGDVLARIDDTTLVAQRDAAEAQVTAAQTQLSEDADASSAQRSADEAQLAAARNQLEAAEEAVENATLRAPFSGLVSAVGYQVGDQAGAATGQNGGASDGGSSAAITVISPRQLLVEASVPASDVSRLKKGMQAEITPTGGGEVVYGTVSEVGVIASASDSGAAQFPVTIAVTGSPTGIYPGSSASVAITVTQAQNVLAVPTQALHSSGGTTYVYVVEDGKRTKRTVAVGRAFGVQTEVTQGLKEGETVEVISITRRPGGGNNGPGNGGTFELPGGGTIKGQFPGGAVPGGGPVFKEGS
ncbi:MAG: efflux RND transporter periplasmic adaptor subunit [Nocardioidaceae bacterium]|nr:efflux RND transporter periplasmic adaptor subunit [Nocardioidaceae bacterium]